MLQTLWTRQGEALRDNANEIPWTVYPRPQMKRESYLNLNGYWDFAVSDRENLPKEYAKTIRVPFCPESQLSGAGVHFDEGAYLFYKRTVKLPEAFNRGRVLLHIGAADQIADVFVNGQPVCHHENGYEAFSCDITEQLVEENEIVIRCRDDLKDQSFPYGKQVMKRGGMWYTPVSGIWQTVWMETPYGVARGRQLLLQPFIVTERRKGGGFSRRPIGMSCSLSTCSTARGCWTSR